jgi:hypothetical protein
LYGFVEAEILNLFSIEFYLGKNLKARGGNFIYLQVKAGLYISNPQKPGFIQLKSSEYLIINSIPSHPIPFYSIHQPRFSLWRYHSAPHAKFRPVENWLQVSDHVIIIIIILLTTNFAVRTDELH